MAILDAASRVEPPLRVGIGIHAGETAETGEGPVGSAVNISARVCAQARAGELIVTDTVRALTRTLVPYVFVPRGTPTLKGIREPMALFRVVEPGDPSAAGRKSRWPMRGRDASPASRRMALIVGSAVVLILMVAVGVFLLTSRGGLGTPSASAPPDGSTPSVALTPSGALNALEADLVSRLAFLEPEVRAECHPGAPEERANGAVASVTCPLPEGAPAASVHMDLFDQPAVMLTAFDAYLQAQGDPTEPCATSALGTESWSVTGVSQGHLLCYREADASHVRWTYEAGIQGLMGSAIRPNGAAAELYAWWREIHPLIAH